MSLICQLKKRRQKESGEWWHGLEIMPVMTAFVQTVNIWYHLRPPEWYDTVLYGHCIQCMNLMLNFHIEAIPSWKLSGNNVSEEHLLSNIFQFYFLFLKGKILIQVFQQALTWHVLFQAGTE